jgi:hypothetical protein
LLKEKEEEEEEGGGGEGGRCIKAKAMNEVDAELDRATPASVRNDADEPLTPPISAQLLSSLSLSLSLSPSVLMYASR